ncbi:ABC transporter permease [Nitratireductor pacificus]|uniref:ABC transporter n=1 Tax=Nitratireductor pacificus pht-3B TaxID=391937 RepID=K2M5G5_9HYPH|nr:ABC transporter [Nitratireductor pacificus]EKF17391.1 ABC transporter [Nitratireductor pacificus pht-3B]
MAIWKRIRPFLSGVVRLFHISYLEAKSDHKGTYLGILWVPLSSLIFTSMLALIFRHSETVPLADFFLYVLAGYVFWGFIASSITGSTDVIQGRLEFAVHNNLSMAGLFGKLLVDRLFIYFINLAPLVLLILILRPAYLGLSLALFAPFMIVSIITSLGTAYLVNMVTIFFPDFKMTFTVGTRFMFFASPVFWSAADVTSGPRAFLMKYNPAAYYLSLPRQVFGIEAFNPTTWLVVAAVSIVVCLAGYLAYHHSQGFVRNLK